MNSNWDFVLFVIGMLCRPGFVIIIGLYSHDIVILIFSDEVDDLVVRVYDVSRL